MCLLCVRYASLYFCCCVESSDNELLVLEVIHRYVELLDKYFGSVSIVLSMKFTTNNVSNNSYDLKSKSVVFNVSVTYLSHISDADTGSYILFMTNENN